MALPVSSHNKTFARGALFPEREYCMTEGFSHDLKRADGS
jgi:hypothetical protein